MLGEERTRDGRKGKGTGKEKGISERAADIARENAREGNQYVHDVMDLAIRACSTNKYQECVRAWIWPTGPNPCN